MDKKSNWQERASKLFCVCVALFCAFFAIKYLAALLLPLAVAFFVSYWISRCSKRLYGATGIPAGIWAFAIVSALVVTLGLSLFFICRYIIGEITIAVRLFSNGDFEMQRIFEALSGRYPFLGRAVTLLEEYDGGRFEEWMIEVLSTLNATLIGEIKNIVIATPSAVVRGIITIISVYYLSIDFDAVVAWIISIFPEWQRRRIGTVVNSAFFVLGRLIRGYGILFLITFVLSLVGLLFIRPSYACLGALAIAVVDALPLLGAGFALVPWAIVSFLIGETARGMGLLALYIVITFVRHVAEPHIIGESMGLRPTIALASMLFGYFTFGFFGMIFAPYLVAVIVKIKKDGGSYSEATVNSDDLSRDKRRSV